MNVQELYPQKSINYEERAKQIVDFNNLRFGSIMPTDIDGLIEYKNKGYVLFETKLSGAEMQFGQRLAFQRICDDLQKSGKPTLLVISRHFEFDASKRIDAASTYVSEYRYKNEWKIPEPNTLITTKKIIDEFIKHIENVLVSHETARLSEDVHA